MSHTRSVRAGTKTQALVAPKGTNVPQAGGSQNAACVGITWGTCSHSRSGPGTTKLCLSVRPQLPPMPPVRGRRFESRTARALAWRLT